MNVPGLRSPYDQVGGLYHFARMLDKIRLHAAGQLPADYQENLGAGFDGALCRFLDVKYDALVARVKQGGTDDEIFQWCLQHGRKPAGHEFAILNDYLRKRGWNDSGSERLKERVRSLDPRRVGEIHTFFNLIEVDEGREPRCR
jgi:hypothetical protein